MKIKLTNKQKTAILEYVMVGGKAVLEDVAELWDDLDPSVDIDYRAYSDAVNDFIDNCKESLLILLKD